MINNRVIEGKMKKILLIAALLIVCGSVATLAVSEKEEVISGTWRYKITVNVETPEGIKSGSAVREAHIELQPSPGQRPYPYHPVTKVKGEAVVVDLGKRGLLFALLDADDYQYVFEAFPGPPGLTPDGVEHYNALPVGSKARLEKDRVWLVTFENIADPKSIKRVEDFSISFGSEVNLKDISIEITDQALTWGEVKKYLTWFGQKIGIDFWNPKEPEPEKYLTNSNFQWGE
jgi:hypothetical protein